MGPDYNSADITNTRLFIVVGSGYATADSYSFFPSNSPALLVPVPEEPPKRLPAFWRGVVSKLEAFLAPSSRLTGVLGPTTARSPPPATF